MEIGLVLCLPRDAQTAHLSREVLDASLAVLGVAADVRDDITLALGEACANVIQHADPADEYEVRVRVVNSQCVIEVVDTGGGFDAIALAEATTGPAGAAEHGRGLKIIDALTENLQIVNHRQHGAIVRFEMPLTWEPNSPGRTLTQTAAGTATTPARPQPAHAAGAPDR